MKSIIYKPFLSQNNTSVPEIKITGYKPRYNWKDESESESDPAPTTAPAPDASSAQPTWTNPEGTKIISDLNDPIYRTHSSASAPTPAPTIIPSTPAIAATIGPTGLIIGKTVSTPEDILVKTPFENKPVVSPQSSTKHIFKTSDINVGNMQGVLDAFADAGIPLRITSG